MGLVILVVISLLTISVKLKVRSQAEELVCSGVCDLEWSPTDENLLAAVNHYGLWLYDIRESESKPALFPFQNATSLDFSPDGSSIAVTACPILKAGDNPCKGIVSIFDLENESWREVAQYDDAVTDVKFSPDGNLTAFVQHNVQEQGIRIINLLLNENLTIVDDSMTVLISGFAFSPDSSLIAISNGNLSWQNRLSVWSATNAELIAVKDIEGLIKDLNFSDTDSIDFVTSDARVLVWDYVAGSTRLSHTMIQTTKDNLHEYNLTDQSTYLLGSLVDDGNPRDRTLYLWDLETGDEIFSIDIPPDHWHNILEINVSGEYLSASDSNDAHHAVDLWEIETNVHHQIVLSD